MLLDNRPYTFDRVVRMTMGAILCVGLVFLLSYLSDVLVPFAIAFLLAYLLKGIPGVHDKVAPELVIAGLVPVVILAIWWTVRRIRHAHGDHAGEEKSS